MVQAWFRCGSDAVGNVECKNNVVHESFKDGSIMLQVWFMRGSGAAQVRLSAGRNTNCNHLVFHVSFNGGSTMVHVWFRRGSGVV